MPAFAEYEFHLFSQTTDSDALDMRQECLTVGIVIVLVSAHHQEKQAAPWLLIRLRRMASCTSASSTPSFPATWAKRGRAGASSPHSASLRPNLKPCETLQYFWRCALRSRQSWGFLDPLPCSCSASSDCARCFACERVTFLACFQGARDLCLRFR